MPKMPMTCQSNANEMPQNAPKCRQPLHVHRIVALAGLLRGKMLKMPKGSFRFLGFAFASTSMDE